MTRGELEEQLAQALRALRAEELQVPGEWRLGRNGSTVLRMLLQRGELAYDVLLLGLYPEGEREDELAALRKIVERLRRKLAKLGFPGILGNSYGGTYWISQEGRRALRAAIRDYYKGD